MQAEIAMVAVGPFCQTETSMKAVTVEVCATAKDSMFLKMERDTKASGERL